MFTVTYITNGEAHSMGIIASDAQDAVSKVNDWLTAYCDLAFIVGEATEI